MSTRLAAVLLIALTLAVWGAVPWGGFQFDDYHNLVLDESMGTTTALGARMVAGIRPLLRLSYALDRWVWGPVPMGYLATNLALHLATVIGVWTLARARLASEVGALVAGAVFAVQPAHAETVAYASGRSTGLMAALLVWSLVCYENARARERNSGIGWYAGSLAMFVAACLAKEVALIFPALLALWEWTRRDGAKPPFRSPLPLAGEGQGEGRGESSARSNLRSHLTSSLSLWERARVRVDSNPRARQTRRVILAVALVACLVFAALLALPRYRDLGAYSLALRSPLASLATNARAVPVMLSLWARPWALSVDHGFIPDGAPSEIAGGAVLIAALVLAAIAVRRHAPMVTLAIGWALLALVPTNSLIAKLDPVTEKPLYLAWFGVALAIGAGFATATARAATAPRNAGALVVAALIAVGAWQAAERVRIWSDARALWLDAVAKAPEKARAWNNLGMAYFARDDDGAALAAFERAVALDPDNRFARRNRALVGFLAAGGDEIRSPRRTR